MFLAEANLGVRLEHPNIVRTVEVGGSKKQSYMALEYLDGQSLRAVRKTLRDVSLEDGVRILSDVLAALHYAHTLCDLDGAPLHIVHRDMSPENIFITYDRRVVLLDFGVAKADDGHDKTEVGKLKGRIRYMAPEQVIGGHVDGRADIFAVGILLWEIITGARFWGGVEEMTILRRLLEGDIPALSEGHRCPPRLAAVCARALAWKADTRYATADDFRRELDEAAHELGERSTLLHLSRQMVQAFSESRARIQALVDQDDAGTGGSTDGDDPLPSVSLPLADPTLGMGSRSGTNTRSVASSPAGVVGIGDPAEPPKSSRLTLLVVGLAVGALAIGSFLLRGRLAPTTTEGASAVATSAAPSPLDRSAEPKASASAPAATIVELVIETTPANAQVTFDDIMLAGGSPYRKRLERDDKTHVLVISAPGYEARKENVLLNGNVTLRLSLEKADARVVGGNKKKAGPGSGGAAETTATATTAPPPGSPPIQGGVAPKRDINPSNPYGN
jgi:serine/threonine-protein kinase